MLSQLIQRQVPIGSKAVFSLKNGREISGALIEIGRDHITIENTGGVTTILTEMIGGWQIIGELIASKDELAELQESNIEDTTKVQSANQILAEQVEQTQTSETLKTEALKRFFEIEARFQAQLQTARIEIKPPDFVFPSDELRGKQTLDASTIWKRMKDRHDYAAKINELGAQFGRIQPVLNDLRILSNWFPTSISVKRHFAYIYWLSGNHQEAAKFYQDAALLSEDAWDWYNVASLALEDGNEELACYGLEQFFHRVSIIDMLEAWYLYVRLFNKFSSYPALTNLCKVRDDGFSEEEMKVLLETGIYLTKVTDCEQRSVELILKWLEGQQMKPLVLEVFQQLAGKLSNAYQYYQQKLSELIKAKEAKKEPQSKVEEQFQGYIYKYNPDRKIGFLRGRDGDDYFFHQSAIIDDILSDMIRNLETGKRIRVVFKTAQGSKGPVAVGISLYRTIDEMFKLATEYANDGEYSKAIAQVKKLLDLNPEYPTAQELYEKWREYTRMDSVPKGSSPYACAKRIQLIEKDLDRAAQLFHAAINQGDNIESAVKDLAGLLLQQRKPQEAINILLKNRNKLQDRVSVDNMLIDIYRNSEQYDKAIDLLEIKLKQAFTDGQKIQILLKIAYVYLRQENYVQAEQRFKTILQLQQDNKAASRNIAFCLFKRGYYDEAEKILNLILDTSPDARAAALLEAITQARLTGQSVQISEVLIESSLSDFSREISGFTQFFLDRCDFQGVPPDRVQRQDFNRSDIQQLEALATQLGTRRPRDRAGYYLSAAKIVSVLEEDLTLFFRYLCRSFASRGDASVIETKSLDVAREFYCEALSAYDGERSRGSYEQDAVNALVRFLYSTLGHLYIPVKPLIPSIDETIEDVLNRHPQQDKVFDFITYLVLRSRYAANRILNHLYGKTSFQAMSLEYLKKKGISVSGSVKQLDDFVRLWNELRRKNFDDLRSISSELRLFTRFELTTASLENGIEHIKGIANRLFFDLDQQRIMQLQKLLEINLDLCKQVTFEEQERLCIQVESRCQELLKEIENSPTKLSVEEIYPIVQEIQNKVKDRLDDLYLSSTPQLSLRLSFESYIPDNNQQIEVQIVTANRLGCSPAEGVELIIQEDEELFVLNTQEVKIDGSLRGGDQRILKVPIRVGNQVLDRRTFSLPAYAQYHTRSEGITQTSVSNFPIRLYSEEEFEEIENPYAAYAEGGIVGEPEMFYGREELIENTARTIRESRAQSKCIIIFGQKRTGKSSILHHLKVRLQPYEDLVILDLGNIGAILDEHSTSPLLYQILWRILSELKYAIEDRVSNGFSPLNLFFPKDREFYEHPSPLVFFGDIFDQYNRSISKLEDWCNTRLVLLIDEFSYIYGQIIAGYIPELFMKNWKALLQKNYFSVVLAGQDVMPKFKQRFPNEFGTTQDERVSYLKYEDAIKLIDEPIRIGGRQGESRYRERAIERIVELTAGSPFYIQIICNRLVEYMNRKRAKLVTEADVEQVKNELIRGVNALGLDKFDNLINSGDTSEDSISDEDTLQVLTAIAKNSQTGPCNRNSIICETYTPIDVILDDLVKREVIERERGQYYSIRVGIFKEWLITYR